MTTVRVRGRPGEAQSDQRLGLLYVPFWIFDHALTFFLPFGMIGEGQSGDSGYMMIALQGAQHSPIVADKLVSPWALATLALTLLENGIGWLCISLVDSEPNVSPFHATDGLLFYAAGLVMMGLMVVTLPLTYLSSVRFKAKEVEAVYVM